MITTPAMPKASKRRRKTRTSNVNHRPPVIASDLKVNELDLTPGKEHLVCPDCSTWVPITGMLGTPKLVPHHTGRAKTAEPRRCTAGSNRRVAIDVEADAWRTKLIEGAPDRRLPACHQGAAEAEGEAGPGRQPGQARPAQRGAGPPGVPSAPAAVPGLQGRGQEPRWAAAALPRR